MFFPTLVRFAAKRTTGLVGVPVVENSREVLMNVYRQTLEEIKNSGIPEDAAYRKDVENLTKYRMGVIEKESDIDTIERTIGSGQIEELIRIAEDERVLIPKYAEWRLWETRDEADARERAEKQ